MSTDIVPVSDPPRGPLPDLRANMMRLPVEQQSAMLAEYKERRDAFRAWLQSQLIEGVHFGYAPGCVPDVGEHNGHRGFWSTMRGQRTFIPEWSWRAKHSLYKAGADFLCDLLGARDEYHADEGAWRMAGGKAGTFVFGCKLVSRATGELLGEGRGVESAGNKGRDENGAVKIAQKRAKVNAVINAWGLSDLFTQDIEDTAPVANENPPRDTNAPAPPPPRNDRVTPVDVKAISDRWKAAGGGSSAVEWARFVSHAAGREFQVGQAIHWTKADLAAVTAHVEALER